MASSWWKNRSGALGRAKRGGAAPMRISEERWDDPEYECQACEDQGSPVLPVGLIEPICPCRQRGASEHSCEEVFHGLLTYLLSDSTDRSSEDRESADDPNHCNARSHG